MPTSAADAGSGTSTGVREVKSAARTLDVLEYLSARQNRPARLRELSEALGVPRSSLHALLRTLVKHGWVRTDASGSLYGIGIRTLLAGTSYLDTDPRLPMVLPLLEELRERLDETFHLGRLDGQDVVFLASRESSHPVRVFSRVGRRMPAYGTSLGKALLADRTGDDRDRHLPAVLAPLTQHTLVDRDALDSDLGQAQVQGYAVDDQESVIGIRCFAVPLRYTRPALDAISVSIPLERLSAAREVEVIEALRATGDNARQLMSPLSGAAWM